jgi:hypothetical protein
MTLFNKQPTPKRSQASVLIPGYGFSMAYSYSLLRVACHYLKAVNEHTSGARITPGISL